MLITRSAGNVVLTIDEEPALDRYLRIHGAPADLADDADAFARFAATHPIGISRRSGDEIRVISSADPADRSITSIGGIPQGVVAHAMPRAHRRSPNSAAHRSRPWRSIVSLGAESWGSGVTLAIG